jgi:hypothetical protein
MNDPKQLVDRYVAIWNDPTPSDVAKASPSYGARPPPTSCSRPSLEIYRGRAGASIR